MDEKKLIQDIVIATKSAFNRLIQNHIEEHFYVFILYTDEDCITVLPAANSIETLNKKILDLKLSDDEIAEFKWSSAEWGYEAVYDEEFIPICNYLKNESLKLTDSDEFKKFKKKVLLCMEEALKSIDNEGFFDERRKDLVLYISSSNDEESYELENESAKNLNSQEKYLEFLDRFSEVD